MLTVATEALRELARRGDTRALKALGQRLLLGIGVAPAPQEGYACLAEAAARGDGEATAQLALFAAWGVLRPHDWAEALDHLQRAAELGWPRAQRELQFLALEATTDWAGLRSRVDIDAWTTPRSIRVLSAAPDIRAIDGFATAAECAWLIGLARGSLRRAKIYRKDMVG